MRGAHTRDGASQPTGRRSLALLPHPGAKPRKKVRARLRSFPGIEQLHRGLQLLELALAAAALRNVRLNLGRRSMGIEQHIGQLRLHPRAICLHPFHRLPPRNLPVGFRLLSTFPQTKSFNFSRSVW